MASLDDVLAVASAGALPRRYDRIEYRHRRGPCQSPDREIDRLASTYRPDPFRDGAMDTSIDQLVWAAGRVHRLPIRAQGSRRVPKSTELGGQRAFADVSYIWVSRSSRLVQSITNMSTEPVSPSPLEELYSEYEDPAALGKYDAVSVRKAARDDRQWSRARVPENGGGCQLKIGDDVFPARVLNRSAEGFGVLVACPDCPSVGQQVQLHTDKGWLPLRVVYVQATQSKGADLDEYDGPWFRLGCTRRLQRSLWSQLWGWGR